MNCAFDATQIQLACAGLQSILSMLKLFSTRLEPIQLQSIWVPSSIIIDGNNITYNMRITDCGSPPDTVLLYLCCMNNV